MNQSELEHRFQFHPADAQNTKDQHQAVRAACLNCAQEINDYVPDGREKSLAIEHLETAMMFGNAGIARADGPRS